MAEMEKIFYDYCDGDKKISAIKKDIRENLVNEFLEFLNAKYDRARRVGGNEVGVIVGQAKDESGFASDIVVVVKCTVKSWYNKMDCTHPVRKYDLDSGTEGKDDPDGADAYEMEMSLKKAPKK